MNIYLATNFCARHKLLVYVKKNEGALIHWAYEKMTESQYGIENYDFDLIKFLVKLLKLTVFFSTDL